MFVTLAEQQIEKTMAPIQLQEVFKTSGVPTYTFVPPIDYNRIIVNLRTPGRALVVEGPSGIGKTTAIKKAIEGLGLQQKVTELKATRPSDAEIIRDLPNIGEFGIVFIDDFHRLDDATKAAIADYVKTLADAEQQNAKVIIVGINEAGRSLINFAPDLVNRIDTVKFENNPDEKILDLIQKGEAALNVEFNCHDNIIEDASGGFYLAQMLCNELCQKADVLEACSTKKELVVSFEGAKSAIWSRLDEKFGDHAKRFALGSRYRPEGRAPYLHLLHGLANSDKWHLDIKQYARTNPDMRLSVMQVFDKGFLADLFLTNPTLSSVLHLDKRAGKIIVEDPQFLFYLRNMPWQSF
ncbi:ATP-binding protein [uncultured Bradyrhizobium sp.]|uniref:ATP-binding protein n=1 Tax=uncultured Bradyrhizobium sp. TaxID=199684 RepID=UPI0035CB749F